MNRISKAGIITLAFLVMSMSMASFALANEDYWDDTTADEEMALFGMGLFCIFPIIMLIIGIVIAIWVYKDAERRGSSGVLWLVIVIFTGIIGLIIWLVVRPPIGGKPQSGGPAASSGRMCPNCGRPIPMDAQNCPYCGKKFGQ